MSKRVKLDFTKYYKNKFYKTDANVKEALKFNRGERKLPLKVLEESTEKQNDQNDGEFIIHWFRNDLRIQDNSSLFSSLKDAKSQNKKVIGLYVISTKFWSAHLESSWKISLIEKALSKLSVDLEQYNIPLAILYLDDAEDDIDFAQWFKNSLNTKFQSNSVNFNLIYDFDELKRDIEVLNSSLNVKFFHDLCVVEPFTLVTNSTKAQYSKFSPWYKKWLAHIDANPIELKVLTPENDKQEQWDFKKFQLRDEYNLPINLQLTSLKSFGVTSHDIQSFNSKFEDFGETSARKNLNSWLTTNAKSYQEFKDFPKNLDSTSNISSYLAIGVLSARYVVQEGERMKSESKDKSYKNSIDAFVREVAFRDFYKHVLSSWPYLEFNLPFNLASLDLKWDEDSSKFEKWALGRTGFPIVDASMRKLLKTGYINNRCRMITASFLAKDLNQDWRWGQNWFHDHLIDCDFSSNNAGWQWCSSVGVDAQPWFRIFNVYTQSKKFDPEGEFIKEWVPELRDVKDKGIIHTGEGVDGYILPIVDREKSREETLDRYRDALT